MRRWLAAVVAGTTLTLGVTACSGTTTGREQHQPPPRADHKPMNQAAAVKSVTVDRTPDNGATGVNPIDPVTLSVTDGSLVSVQLHSSSGAVVSGKFSSDRHSWSATEVLGYGRTYTWKGTAKNTAGKSVPITGSFKTLAPSRTVSASLNTGDSGTYGIAMPIVLNFDHEVHDKAAVQKALSVKTSVPTQGSWAWLSDTSVHWRPKTYWTPGTDVSVSAQLYGVPFGEGDYGAADLTAHFSIGARHVIKGNVDTHRLKLYANGKLIHNYPASYGLDSVLWRNTRSGTHVVMSKHPVYSMSNPRAGYSNVVVQWAVRISNNGEFIHAYPLSEWAQGNTNVSHGCVNLSTARAKAVYDWVQIGDPVQITGSRVDLSPADGDYYDWTLNWSQWQAKSAVPLSRSYVAMHPR